MRYSDDIISFEIPEGFSKKINVGNGSWKATSKSYQAFLIYTYLENFGGRSAEEEFEDFFSRCSDFLTRIDIPTPHIAGCRRAAYTERPLNDFVTPPYVEVEVRLLLEKFIIVTRICDFKTDEHFQLDKYMPSIESIELDYEKYCELIKKIQTERDEKIQEALQKQKKYSENPKKRKRTQAVSERAQKILDEMDAGADSPYRFLPDLEHGYFYTAGSRITIFGDENRWAVAFEKTGYANRGSRIEIEVNYFGNCLTNLDTAGHNGIFVSNTKCFSLLDTMTICGDFEIVSPEIKTVSIRNKEMPIPRDPKAYRKRKIDWDDPKEIGIVALSRILGEMYPELFRATDEELRTCIPADLPKIMEIDQWHHPAFNGDEMETNLSDHETFRLIAEVLASLDPKKWKPKMKPNNHWHNWPEAGGL